MNIKLYDLVDLKAAVEDAATPPVGEWRVEDKGDDIYLIWECAEADWPEDAYGDEPWTDWGGDAIIAAAGIGEHDDAWTDVEDGVITNCACWSRP